MWPLQPTQGIPDRLAAALAALVVTGAVLTLILMLTMGGRHEAKRAVTLPVVYWSGPPPEAPDEMHFLNTLIKQQSAIFNHRYIISALFNLAKVM